jgi:hypothetical protein
MCLRTRGLVFARRSLEQSKPVIEALKANTAGGGSKSNRARDWHVAADHVADDGPSAGDANRRLPKSPASQRPNSALGRAKPLQIDKSRVRRRARWRRPNAE